MTPNFVPVWGGGANVKFGGHKHPELCLTSVGSEFEAAVEYYNITAQLRPGSLTRDVYRLYYYNTTAVGRHWKCL